MDVFAFHCSCLSGVSIGIQTLHRENTQIIKPSIMFSWFFADNFFRTVPCSKRGVGAPGKLFGVRASEKLPRSFRADRP